MSIFASDENDTTLEESFRSLFPGLDRREISKLIEVCMQCMQHGIGYDDSGPMSLDLIRALAEDHEPPLNSGQLAEIERRTRLKNVLRRSAFKQHNYPLANLTHELDSTLIRSKNSEGGNIIESRLLEKDSPRRKPEPYYGDDDRPRPGRDSDW